MSERNKTGRMGARLRREGFPEGEPYYLDMDLRRPSLEMGGAVAVYEQLEDLCGAHGGKVVDVMYSTSCVLARVEASRDLAETLLRQDIVAQVDLPPVLDM